MAISDYKITDTTGVKVGDVPGDSLTGDVQDNKDTFDKYSDLIVSKYNDLVDYLATQGIDSLDTWKANVLKTVYPIGAVYMSTSATSPATLFGGTWAQLKDRFLLAAGDSYSVNATGGYTDAVLLKHRHQLTDGRLLRRGTKNFSAHVKTESSSSIYFTDFDANTYIGDANFYTVNEGSVSSGTGRNMPPYLVVYMWKRTA